MANDMKDTGWKLFDGDKMRIRAKYGMSKIKDQDPYFSITGEIERYERCAWREDACGCIHEDIAKHFPELKHLIKWHLFGETAGPMHYVANAIYWWEMATARRGLESYDRDVAEAFAHTILLGAVNGEESAPKVEKVGGDIVFSVCGCYSGVDEPWSKVLACEADVKAFLDDRFPALIERFTSFMKVAGVL